MTANRYLTHYQYETSPALQMPSVKNFQLAKGLHDDNVYLQFGKVDKDVFHLDFQSPYTPFQAFAVAISQFNL